MSETLKTKLKLSHFKENAKIDFTFSELHHAIGGYFECNCDIRIKTKDFGLLRLCVPAVLNLGDISCGINIQGVTFGRTIFNLSDMFTDNILLGFKKQVESEIYDRRNE